VIYLNPCFLCGAGAFPVSFLYRHDHTTKRFFEYCFSPGHKGLGEEQFHSLGRFIDNYLDSSFPACIETSFAIDNLLSFAHSLRSKIQG